jgi:hypothetical protein
MADRNDYDQECVFQERIDHISQMLAFCNNALDRYNDQDAHPNRHYLCQEIKYLLIERERAQRRLVAIKERQDNNNNNNNNS